ncbi:60 kDa SS-A/Ro ribonucleoprotein [Variovorax boronicumulans]|uniref:60 kDa SS-A/Ro ribonucleoprotein n=1 Tax=Variovorax boronicumulans TaxID=436515 RepID=A0AAW8CXN6_9BURK|nr:RNA-binding protein [Variovorax boronicumulans]MDP9892488.1 60 kDa SS-A/Ro ribonucleoprotein [Variovorax boronicumulans]MDQ0052032.1 60 kDa SS-A/Ro ribonucleoprotein [Variovorax boronicumulans]
MANLQLFQTQRGALLPSANALNEAGGAAYALSPKHLLAQLAATGCLNNTFYAQAQDQLDAVLALAREVDPVFVAKTAVYARRAGHMKDMPALLAATLAVRDVSLLAKVFDRVVDNGKMLRNFVQMLRSGAVGRKSLGTRPKKLVQQWLLEASEAQLLNASVGNTPSLADVVKMVHPKPAEAWRAAWFAWLIDRPYALEALPPVTQAFERFKRDRSLEVPDVPFQMLTALELDTQAWAQIAQRGSWQMVRQNLNTFARHGVFELPGLAEAVAAKLRDPQAVAKARVLPYQLMAAFTATGAEVPHVVKEALQDAMELALANVPVFEGRVVVCPDVSGSMSSPVTGHRGTATTSVRCIDVAALVAAAVLRRNADARVLPFETKVVSLKLIPRDSVMTNAAKLAAVGGGGTSCSAPLALLNKEKAKADLVVLVSDNESWADRARGRGTATMQEWAAFKERNPKARLVCIDIQPYATTQAQERDDVLNIGGFSDEVFKLLAVYAAGGLGADHWVGVIEETSI